MSKKEKIILELAPEMETAWLDGHELKGLIPYSMENPPYADRGGSRKITFILEEGTDWKYK
jgi:hypothetical protein